MDGIDRDFLVEQLALRRELLAVPNANGRTLKNGRMVTYRLGCVDGRIVQHCQQNAISEDELKLLAYGEGVEAQTFDAVVGIER